MTHYSEEEVVAAIDELLAAHDMTWDEFVALGESDELTDPDLDFAFRYLVPHIQERPVSV